MTDVLVIGGGNAALCAALTEEEFWQDLLKVTGGRTNEQLERLSIRASATCRPWMVRHGVRFQPSLSGALHTARTNALRQVRARGLPRRGAAEVVDRAAPAQQAETRR